MQIWCSVPIPRLLFLKTPFLQEVIFTWNACRPPLRSGSSSLFLRHLESPPMYASSTSTVPYSFCIRVSFAIASRILCVILHAVFSSTSMSLAMLRIEIPFLTRIICVIAVNQSLKSIFVLWNIVPMRTLKFLWQPLQYHWFFWVECLFTLAQPHLGQVGTPFHLIFWKWVFNLSI